jgi:hypothetical protein
MVNNSSATGHLPSLTGRWMRLVLGFSVSVGVGLAPYLGKLKVPLFTPMLSLIPESLQGIAVPLSAASMGLVAVLVQWYGSQQMRQKQLSAWFGRSVATCVGALFLLAAIEMIAVVRVDVPAVDGVVSFAVGPSHPNVPPCVGLSRQECIKSKLTLDEAKIDSYFGENIANITKLSLVVVYVTFMSMFGVMVGLMMLSQQQRNART